MQSPAKFTRSSDLVPHSEFAEISVIGGGGIGSFLIQLLAVMGYRQINLFEFDTVEIHNAGCGLFGEKDVGEEKAEVARARAEYYGATLIPMGRFNEDSEVTAHMAVCPDDLPVRLLAYRKWREKFEGNGSALFVDGRMGGVAVELHTELANAVSEYPSTINPDAVEEEATCARRHTVFTGAFAATLMAMTISAMVNKQAYRKFLNISTIPYFDMQNPSDLTKLVQPIES